MGAKHRRDTGVGMAKLFSSRTALAVCAFALSANVLSTQAQAACTIEKPCTVRIAFRYTEAALADIKRVQTIPASAQGCVAKHKDQGYCLFDDAVENDINEIAAAFERSGITQTKGKKKSIVFLADKPRPGPGIDGGVAANLRADRPTAWRGSAGAFNNNIVVSLGSNAAIKTFNASSDINIFVLFTGFRDAKDACGMNSVQTNGFIVLPACMIAESVLSERHKVLQKLLFLHEAGHSFGGGHDDNADPGFQPCVGPAQAWVTDPATRRSTLVTKQFDRRPGCAYRYPPNAPANSTRGFCTILGYNNPSGKHCAAHTAGLAGTGWILEYSHTQPRKCATPPYQAIDCGDANHDNAKVMSANAPDVARLGPGDALPRGSR